MVSLDSKLTVSLSHMVAVVLKTHGADKNISLGDEMSAFVVNVTPHQSTMISLPEFAIGWRYRGIRNVVCSVQFIVYDRMLKYLIYSSILFYTEAEFRYFLLSSLNCKIISSKKFLSSCIYLLF